MSKRSAADWLSDIVLWGERLQGHLQGVDRDAFFLSTVLQDAASKCAEAIGEAAGKLDDIDPALNDTFPDLNLKLARRSRDRLSHGYYRIDLDILWNTVTIAIPKTVAAAKLAKVSDDHGDGSGGGASGGPPV
jgi:uncharacterized protein with HEPN domain